MELRKPGVKKTIALSALLTAIVMGVTIYSFAVTPNLALIGAGIGWSGFLLRALSARGPATV